MQEFMKNGAIDAVGSTPDALRKYLERQVATYAEVIRKGHIQLQ
jgi:tripartite-type tricarboxylate transporter receptor subunit TctC